MTAVEPSSSNWRVALNERRVLLTVQVPEAYLGEIEQALGSSTELVYRPAHPGWEAQSLRDLLVDIDAVLAGGDTYTAWSMERASSLRVIARIGVGFDRIDLDAATDRGIFVTTTPGANAAAVADLTLGFIVALLRDMPARAAALRAGRWDPQVGSELAGKRLGLIGFGAIGMLVARRALAFDMIIDAYDPFVPPETIGSCGVTATTVESVLAGSDIVSLHLPSRPETNNFMNADRLAAMRPRSYLVNTARGDLVDEAATLVALQSGHLAGAALDVSASEPPSGLTEMLISDERVIATPHIAGSTEESNRRSFALAIESVKASLDGQVPMRALNHAAVVASRGPTSRLPRAR
jgi:D-3-phosphoglycerate dehydrogenase / 2-oxoglutarate reductase